MIFTLCFVLIAWAQSDKKVKVFDEESGLFSSTILSVSQDNRGYIWIAGTNGVYKFDGNQFKLYQNNPQNPQSLADNFSTAIVSIGNYIVIGSYSSGVSVLNLADESWTHFNNQSSDALKSNQIYHLNPLQGNRVLISTQGGGLHVLNLDLMRIESMEFLDKIKSKMINVTFIDSDSLLYVGSSDQICEIIDLKTGQRMEIEIYKHNAVPFSFSEFNNKIYYGSQNKGLFVAEKGRQTFRFRNQKVQGLDISKSTIWDLKSYQNQLYIASNDKGLIITDTTLTLTEHYHVTAKTALSKNEIRRIFFDGDTNLWLCSWGGGINYIFQDLRPFSNLQFSEYHKHSLHDKFISSIYVDQRDHVWIGSRSNGILILDHRLNSQMANVSALKKLESKYISCINGFNDEIWVSSFNGLYRFKWQGNTLLELSLPEPLTELTKLSIFYISKDPYSEDIYFSTFNEGLYRYRKNKLEALHRIENKDLSKIKATKHIITEDKIYLASEDSGLYIISKDLSKIEHWSSSQTQRRLLKNQIYDLKRIDSKLYMASYGAGLIILDLVKDSCSYLATNDGLSSNSTLSILYHEKGRNLWIGSSYGLNRLDLKTGELTHYFKSDGLQSNEFSENSVAVLNDSIFLMGGYLGLTYFNPTNIQLNPMAPTIRLNDIRIAYHSILTSGSEFQVDRINPNQIQFSYDQNILSFSFTTLEFKYPEKIQFRAFLKNFNDQFIDLGNENSISYTNLSAGDYHLYVSAANEDKKWSDAVNIVSFTIQAPAWLRWYAYIFYLCLVIGIIWLYQYLKNKKLIDDNRKLEVEIFRRTKALEEKKNEIIHKNIILEDQSRKMKELSEARNKFFANISHELKTPLTLILSPVKDLIKDSDKEDQIKTLTLIERNAQRLLQLITNLLDISKMESGHISVSYKRDDVLLFLKKHVMSFESFILNQNKHFKVKIPNAKLIVDFDENLVEKVINNLLSNAAKYTDEKKTISVEFFETTYSYGLKVLDNGIGIAEEFRDKIFNRYNVVPKDFDYKKMSTGLGLSFSREITELMNGKLYLNNENKQLTEFVLELPKNLGHKYDDNFVSSAEDAIIEKKRDKLFIIDDMPDIIKYLEIVLRKEFDVQSFYQAKHALSELEKEMPDLILSDYMMPQMNGLEFCKAVKSSLSTNHIPVILLTAKTSNESIIEAFESGADDYITKPFNSEVLLKKIKSILNNRAIIKNKFLNSIEINKESESHSESFLNQLEHYIWGNTNRKDFDLKHILEHFNLSQSTLYRKLRTLTDMNINQFIRFIRLKKAAKLLKEGQMNISQVSFECGYDNLSYFSKCFREQYQKSPKEYLENADLENA